MLIWLSRMVLVGTLLHCLPRLVEAQQSLKPALDWLDSLIGLGGFLPISSLASLCGVCLSFMSGVG